MTTSNPRFVRFGERALRARDRIHLAGRVVHAHARPACATTVSCWIAAGRLTSVETSSGCLPCFASHFASLPAVVVLPEPCSPSSRITRGRCCVGGRPPFGVAEERQHLVADDPDDLLRRRQALQDVLLHRPIAHAIDERLDDLEVDVGFEQRQPDLAQRGLDRSRASGAFRRAGT